MTSKLDKQLTMRTFRVKPGINAKTYPDHFIGVEIVGPDGVEDMFVPEEIDNAIRKTQEELDEVQGRLDSLKALKVKMRVTIDAEKAK